MKNPSSDIVTNAFLEIKLAKIDDKARDYRDDILNKLDEVMGELETIREENLIGTYQLKELRKQDANHERRLRKLEHVQKGGD